MPDITIGSVTLDSTYTPKIKVSTEYFKTSSQEIIGGVKNITITGTFAIGDDGSLTGAIVMSKLKEIRDLGRDTSCVNIDIPGYASGLGKIVDVKIEQGSDPTWINVGSYIIELKSKLDVLPQNSLGISLDDWATSVERSESLQLGEESHGYIVAGTNFIKSFVKVTNKTTVSCMPLCPGYGTPIGLAKKLLNKLFKSGLTNSIFSEYKSWQPYLQSRTMETNNAEGSITLTAEIILIPPCGSSTAGFVDLQFGFNKAYDGNNETRTISGSINGLASIAWTDNIVSNPGSASKYNAANTILQLIKARYSDISSWQGIQLELEKKPNCPDPNINPYVCKPNTTQTSNGCIKPSSSNISKSRTDGVINFNFQWDNSQSNCEINGMRCETVVDIADPENRLAFHLIPRYGTVIQDLNCLSAKRVNLNVSITSDRGGCTPDLKQCAENKAIEANISQYFTGSYIIIGDTSSISLSGYTIRREYIELCP
jgi:hypothetical protein